MAKKKIENFTCPLCSSDIPAEENAEVDDVVYCSYCLQGLRIVLDKDQKLTVIEEE